MAKQQKVSNWGNYPKQTAQVTTLDFVEDVQKFVKSSKTVLARGNGRCYGDAALHDNIFSTLALDKILDFDINTGIITCQSGVILEEIINLVLPKGFFLPVTPGTKFITIGGAIAADVHGKNHHSEGCFSNHVYAFDLLIEDGSILTCSKTENTDLFWQTIGGMGLTGIILQATFQLKKVETAYIKQETLKAKNLEEVMQFFEESENWTYTVAWIDCLQKGEHQGRSILYRGEHATLEDLPTSKQKNPLQIPNKLKLLVPFNLPSFTMSTLTVKVFNFLYFNKVFKKRSTNIIDYDTYFYPLDGIHHWNRIYGKKGFAQYQFVLPLAASQAGLKEILDLIRKSGQGSFVTVLKLFGKHNPNAPLSFPMEGYTLALDFKVNKGLPKLIEQLDEIVERYKGRIYRAKDAMSKKELLQYPKQTGKFTSLQFKRYTND